MCCFRIDPLHDPVTWYGINYTGTQITQWDFQNKGTRTSPARLSFVLKVPLRNLRPSAIYSVPCDRIVQRAYWYRLGGEKKNHAHKTGSWYLLARGLFQNYQRIYPPFLYRVSPGGGGGGVTNLYSSQCPNKSCSICLQHEQDSCSQEHYTVLSSS